MKYHIFKFVGIIELSGRCHNTGPEACILSNGEVMKYHIFISVVVIELSVRCLNTGPEDRLPPAPKADALHKVNN